MKILLGTILSFVLIGGVFAQEPTGSEIKDRKENQQDRIANGVASGQLTAGETAKLEKQESTLNKEIAKDRKANGGNLTNKEKQQINAQQNKLSKEVYTDKHNAATQHYGNNEVDKRRENQQDRIAGGIKSGQLSAGEAAKLETQESKINKEVRTERAANGGNLTNKQKAQINKQQNRESKRIYNKKHNAAEGVH
ncbi:MAG TPA: hypothetical protein VMG30_18840 [Acidobacteriota bacterium]|nr:hypothetical protein [Acidobacteriota bacterium]